MNAIILVIILFMVSFCVMQGACSDGPEAAAQVLSFFRAKRERPRGASLRQAVRSGDCQRVHRLLRQGVDVNKLDKAGFGALHYAVLGGSPELVKLLAGYGVWLDLPSSQFGLTPLHIAVILGSRASLRTLLELGAGVNIQDKFGRTPLAYAAGMGNESGVAILIEAHADPLLRDAQGRTPFDLGLQYKHKKIVKRLRDSADNSGKTMLHLAAREGDVEHVQRLLEAGADPLIEDIEKQTALDYARFYRRNKVVDLLVNAQDRYGDTLLHVAARTGDLDEIDYLIDHGADLEVQDRQGKRPVHHAAEFNQTNSLASFISHGAELSAGDKRGNTPLHMGAARGYVPVVRWVVLQNPGLIDVANNQGKTALHSAAENGQLYSVATLLSYGSLLNKKDNQGDTPLDVARIQGDPRIISVLERNGARSGDSARGRFAGNQEPLATNWQEPSNRAWGSVPLGARPCYSECQSSCKLGQGYTF